MLRVVLRAVFSQQRAFTFVVNSFFFYLLQALQRKGVSRGQVADAAERTNLSSCTYSRVVLLSVELHAVILASWRTTGKEGLVFAYLNPCFADISSS